MKNMVVSLMVAWFTAAGTVSEAQAPAFIQGEFTPKAALALVFKNVDSPEWTEDGRLHFQESGTEHYARGIGEFAVNEKGAERRLFVFEMAPAEDNTCRACKVSVGAAIFSHQGQRWRLVEMERRVDEQQLGRQRSSSRVPGEDRIRPLHDSRGRDLRCVHRTWLCGQHGGTV